MRVNHTENINIRFGFLVREQGKDEPNVTGWLWQTVVMLTQNTTHRHTQSYIIHIYVY